MTWSREALPTTTPAAGAAELALDALFLEPDAARLEGLVRRARAVERWSGLVTALEAHGVLGIFRRNVALARADVPAFVRAELDARAAALREDARRLELTLVRFLEAAGRRGVEVTLLKGAALAAELYPEPGLRSQADVDLLVAPGDLRTAVRAGADAGLLQDRRALPIWWYRLAHFHLKLQPTSALLREIELHWALQHDSLLLTPRLDDVRARRRTVAVGGQAALVLDPIDGLLHLVTHLASHAEGLLGRDRAALVRVAAAPTHPLRLKWLLDVRAEVERAHEALPPAEVVARARVWGAEQALAGTLAWIATALGFRPFAARWVQDVTAALGPLPEPERDAPDHEPGPLEAFDFRERTLARAPRWFWPPSSYLARRYGAASLARRAQHASGIALHGLSAACALPCALAGRALAAPSRARAWRRATAPERVLDLAAAWRARGRERP